MLSKKTYIILAGTLITVILILLFRTYNPVPLYNSMAAVIGNQDNGFENLDGNHVFKLLHNITSTSSNTTYLDEGMDNRKDSNQKLILFWTEFYGMRPTAVRENFFNVCQESNCVATMDRTRLQEADVVVFFLFRTNWLPGDLPGYRFLWQLYVAWMYESAAYPWVSKMSQILPLVVL